jgi:hypothetical protein
MNTNSFTKYVAISTITIVVNYFVIKALNKHLFNEKTSNNNSNRNSNNNISNE